MPGHLFVALAVGLVVGLALGGRPWHLAEHRLRAWWLLPAGLGTQIVIGRFDVPAPFALLLASYVCLLAFSALNLRYIGMGIVLIGIALNMTVIAANSGMPVRGEAIEQAGGDVAESFADPDGKHVLEDGDSKLMFLGDIIPVRAMGTVLSFGDLIICVGLSDLLVHLMRPIRRRGHDDEKSEDVVIDLREGAPQPTPAPSRRLVGAGQIEIR